MTGPSETERPGGSAALRPDQIIETALAAASPQSDGTVVLVTAEGTANVRWANNTMTTNGLTDTLSWSVVSIKDGAAGTVTGSVVDAQDRAAVGALVGRAEGAAQASASAGRAQDFAKLVGPQEAGGSDAGFGDDPAPADFNVYHELIDGLAAALDSARSKHRILYGFARRELTTTYLGTSTGVRRRWVQPTGILEVNLKSDDLARSAWAGASTTDFTDVDVAAMAARLDTRLGWAERRFDLPPGRYDTVLPPTAVADFLVFVAWSAAARPAYEGRSAFSAPGGGTRIGDRLTDRPLTLASDPAAPGLATCPFVATGASTDVSSVFDNGAPVARTELIRDGVLAALGHTRGSAAEFGAPFTPLTSNVLLTGGTPGRTVDDLVAGVDRGLLVTSQWYIREVDPMTMLLTGLTRDGVFLIEHGEIAGAVNNFRFNMSPLDVLRQAVDIGQTERALSREWSDWFTRSAMPPLRVEGFNMSSVSQAT